jgi:hypothetical protein
MAVIFSLPWALLMWSYVVLNLPRHYFQLIFPVSPPSLDGGQDGYIFHCTIVVLFHYLELTDTYIRLCVVRHDGSADRGMHSDLLAIERRWGPVAEQPCSVEALI